MALDRTATRAPFLPPAAVAALRGALVRATGALVVLACTAAAAALLTYTPTDPSLNTASGGPVNNALGEPGALFADLLLQWSGAGMVVPLFTIAIWGLRLLAGQGVPNIWLRTLGLVTATLLAAVALNALPPPEEWPVFAGLGGYAGQLLHERVAIGLGMLGMDEVPFSISGLPAGIIGLVLWQWTSVIRWRDWKAMGQSFAHLWRTVTGGVGGGLGGRLAGLGKLVARRSADTVEEADTGKAKAKAKAARRDRIRDKAAAGASGTTESGGGKAEGGDPPFDAGPTDLPPAGEHRRTVVEAPRATGKPVKEPASSRQGSLLPEEGVFTPPPLDLLAPPKKSARGGPDAEALSQNARLLEGVLADFGVKGEIVKVRPGPVVTLYELEPAPGTKTSRVVGLADDIARSMSAVSVRIAVVPGRSVIGIELPNRQRETVTFRELLSQAEFARNGGGLVLALGKDIGGAGVYVDLARMPHLLIAGTTGSGKSVAINTMILSLLYRGTPDQVRFIMIDPKMLELSVYDGIPHLLSPVVTDPGKAVVALKWAVREMETRYRAMSQLGVRNIAGYNQKVKETADTGGKLTRTVQTGFDPETGKPVYEDQEMDLSPLPFIVVVVDEMADLMLVAGKDVEAAIQRLAQMARAAGIHLIMATQRPSVDVITGTIKANFPTRISFQVTSKIDSRTILGEQGAEQLLGQGDMLYMAAGGRITRTHGPFVSDAEVESICDHLRRQGQPAYVDGVTEEDEEADARIPGFPTGKGGDSGDGGGAGGGSGDDLFDRAVAVVARERKASTSFVQRQLQIGYNRAARLIERMEKEGMVGKPNHVGKREVLLPPLVGEE